MPDTLGGAEKIMKVKNAIDLLTNYVKSLPEGDIRQAIQLVIRETKSFQTVKNRDEIGMYKNEIAELKARERIALKVIEDKRKEIEKLKCQTKSS